MDAAASVRAHTPPIAARDRVIALATLFVITVAAWFYVLRLDRTMSEMTASDDAMHTAMQAMGMPMQQPWGVADAGVAFVLWSVMMVAMMTPSAAPLVLMYHRMHRARAGRAWRNVHALLAGYLAVWIGFSIAATLLQGALHAAGLLAPGADRVGSLLGGALFVIAGAWQLTPLKHACLTRCRSPMDVLVTEWCDGSAGAFLMGLRHGGWCVGCCWALMLVLFAAGVMNLLWVALLAGWILLEKTLPSAQRLQLAGGMLAIAFGSWQMMTALLG